MMTSSTTATLIAVMTALTFADNLVPSASNDGDDRDDQQRAPVEVERAEMRSVPPPNPNTVPR